MKVINQSTYNEKRRSYKDLKDKIPFSHSLPDLDFNTSNKFNNIKKRPFKNKSQDLSFKGLSSFNAFKAYEVEKAVQRYGEEFGTAARENFKKAIEQADSIEKVGLSVKDGAIEFTDQTFWQGAVDTLIYPITGFPLDAANSFLGVLKKIPLIKDSSLLKNALDIPALKNRRVLNESISYAHSIKGYLEKVRENKEGFETGLKRLDPLIGNYSAEAERGLTRFVTGAIPAFFLANDAYNLSIYMNNNKDVAKKEKKKRFNQEAARIILTAGATFGVMKLFSKSSNKSQNISAALITIVAFASEFLGRMMVGTPVLPVSKEQAKEYARRQGKIKDEKTSNKPAFSSNLITNAKMQKSSNNFEGENAKSKESANPPKKGKLTFANAIKVIGGLILFGYGAKRIQEIKPIADFFKGIKTEYEKLFKIDFEITRKEFDKLMKKLNDNGFNEIADKYQKEIADQKGEKLKLGRTTNRTKEILIHHILTFPIRYAWGVINLPYNLVSKTGKLIDEKILKYNEAFRAKKSGIPVKPKIKAELTEEQKKAEHKALKEKFKNGLEYLRKIEKDPNSFKKNLNRTLLSGFDNVTKSDFDNAEFGNLIKTTSSAVTSAFLIADNYNMVMIDSQGKDKELAEQKAKERTIQRGIRLAYGVFIIKFFSSMFAKTFNNSLLGAEAVNSLQVIATETLERKSVGLPLKEASREEIIEAEKENLNATGIKGDYFKLMAKLTGKKPLSDRKTDKK